MTRSTENSLRASEAFRRHALARLHSARDAIDRCFDALLMNDDYVVERALGELLVFYGAGREEIDEIIGISLDTLRIGPTYREPTPAGGTPSDCQPIDPQSDGADL